MAKKRLDIKQMASEAVNSAPVPAPMAVEPAPVQLEVSKIEFDVWYAMRKSKIPGHHHKEILMADFRGRGLKGLETVDSFDKALRKYGVSL